MSKGAKIFVISIFTFFIIALAIAFFTLNQAPISTLRNNKESSELESNKETEVVKVPYQPPTQNDTKNVVKDNPPAVINPTYIKLSSYKTTIYDKEKNRIHNIGLASEKLDGTIVKTGEEFSFNNTIGPMDSSQGFKKATGFNGKGKKIKVYGGGICQLSSTLYNAAMDAGLEITERHPHSKRVYYVPKNKDATINYGGADLKFKNTTDKDIKISSTTDGHTVTINIEKIG